MTASRLTSHIAIHEMARKYNNPYGIYKPGKRGGIRRRAENESIELLYFDYKLKRPGSDTALLKGMWPYIEPIFNTVIHGSWYSIKDKLWVQFLQHYMTHSIQHTRALELGNMENKYEFYIRITIEYVRKLFKGIPKEELKQIMLITIFEMANTYRHQGKPNFLLYFSMYYTHRLSMYIKPLINDYLYYGTMIGKREPLNHQALLADEDYSPHESYNAWYYTLYNGDAYSDKIDTNWVIGFTTKIEAFETLSRYDRQLLKWRYIDNIGEESIAERLCISVRTVRRYIAKLRNRLQTELAVKHLLIGGDENDGISGGTDDNNTKPKDNTMSGLRQNP